MADDIRLTHEEAERLRQLHDEIAPARDAINRLKRIGTIPVDDLEEKFDTLLKTREGLLEHFPPRKIVG